uniref:Uncharacterized protein n=1 Tax=Psilocybe cubensis TaxID=181762 RepID=A0A8H8CNK1_PSICU
MTSLHDEHLNDSRYSHDITIENVRSSRADSMSSTSKEKYTVHSTIEAASTKDKEEGEVEDDYPDGGTRAWLILAGAMCNTFSTREGIAVLDLVPPYFFLDTRSGDAFVQGS